MLVDHADAVADGILRIANAGFDAVDADLAGIRVIEAIQHLHQGRFAGAVFAQQGMNFARLYIEVNLVGSQHTGKALDDAGHFQRVNAGVSGGEQIGTQRFLAIKLLWQLHATQQVAPTRLD